MMRRIVISIIVSFFIFGSTSSQDSASEVFAPFVSLISATSDTTGILISWKNSEDLIGYKRIYRNTVEITPDTFAGTTMVARVSPETESYKDTPQSDQSFFYAVLLEAKDGELYKVFIPYRNKTIVSARLEIPTGGKEVIAEVSDITAEVIGDSVVIRFNASNKTRDLILYRSTSPISGYSDLLKASYSILVTAGSERVKDVPVAGLDYYYAVIDAGSVSSGKVRFVSGTNATSQPVQIPIRDVLSRSEGLHPRTYPLPAPHILYSIETGEELLPPVPFLLPQEVKLVAAVEKPVDNLITRMKRQKPELEPKFLAEDESENLQGEEVLLSSLVSQYLKTDDYRVSIEKFGEFLRTRHQKKVEARARFYLGQAYYFHGQYREGLMEFIFAQDEYYVETQAWIDVSLLKLDAQALR